MAAFGILPSAVCAVLLTGLSFSRNLCGLAWVFPPYACSDVVLQTDICLENKRIVFMHRNFKFHFNIVFLKGLAT